MSESAISHSIKQYLISQDIPVERIQSGVLCVQTPGRRPRWVHCADGGTPDLWCALCGGCFLEVKTPDGRLSTVQKQWHDRARLWGVKIFVVRSVDDVIRLREGRSE